MMSHIKKYLKLFNVVKVFLNKFNWQTLKVNSTEWTEKCHLKLFIIKVHLSMTLI